MKKSQIRAGTILGIDSALYHQRVWVRVGEDFRFIDKYGSSEAINNLVYLSMDGCERLRWDEASEAFVSFYGGEADREWVFSGQRFHLRSITMETTGREWRNEQRYQMGVQAEEQRRDDERRNEYQEQEAIAHVAMTSMLRSMPDAFVSQTANGFPRMVQMARDHGVCDVHPKQRYIDGDAWRSLADTDAPDGDVLLRISLTALAAAAHAWDETYGVLPWDDVVAFIYQRHMEKADA